MPYGHQGDRYHHDDIHYQHGHTQHTKKSWIGWPLLAVLLRTIWRSNYYSQPHSDRGGGCSIFAVMFGILIIFAFIRFWWLLILIAILAVVGMLIFYTLPRNRSTEFRTSQRQFNHPRRANQPYEEGYSALSPESQPYQQNAPQSGWGQYEMPEAQYPRTMPPMQ